MGDKKPEDKKEKDPFSDSSEIFESIFKEASHEIQSETEKVAPKTGLKPKPKPGIKPKPEAKPKAPTKLEVEPKEEPEPKKDLLQDRPPSEQKPRLQPPAFKPRQEPVRRPITRTARPEEETTRADMVSTQPLTRTRIQEQTAKEESVKAIGRRIRFENHSSKREVDIFIARCSISPVGIRPSGPLRTPTVWRQVP